MLSFAAIGCHESDSTANDTDTTRENSFQYDPADRSVWASLLENSEYYEADLEVVDGEQWMTWLEFVPGEGDRLWIGRRDSTGWQDRQQLSETPAAHVGPRLTNDGSGQLWMTYEAENSDGTWDVFVRRQVNGLQFSEPIRLSRGSGNDINHAAEAGPDGSLWVTWQTDRGGQFDVLLRQVSWSDGDINPASERVVSESLRGDWEPEIAVSSTGAVRVAWDAFDGRSFDVHTRRYGADGEARPVTVVAQGKSFQGRVSMASDQDDRTWILWEQGSSNWGEDYMAQDSAGTYHFSDNYGPLHRYRQLNIARLHDNGDVMSLEEALPMPSLDAAADRSPLRRGVKQLGAYYERGELAVDGQNRLWVVYRHFYQTEVGLDQPMGSHVEQGWRLYGRHLHGEDWSPLYSMDVHQRDGRQRLSISPLDEGIAAAWTTGRTDRRENPRPRGVALATLHSDSLAASNPELLPAQPAVTAESTPPAEADPDAARVDGKEYQLVMGDLHRHTDLSLCFPFFDGSIDDAYRYAIEVAELDFLGITDHTRDIDRGDALSQLWWRSTKEVQRHRLQDTFFPYFAYERSHGDTDHNVISLRHDMLRNWPPPLPEFWEELGDSTFTIPHAPVRGDIWDSHDDQLRPLMEIYQGFRDRSSHQHAHDGLDQGHHFGFIASSDHMSTHRSYAGVWTLDKSRASIFQAMQHRRTFGATDHIRLIFRSGNHWMGERFEASAPPSFQLEVDGTAEISSVDLYRDGELVRTLPLEANDGSIELTFHAAGPITGEHYYYVYLRQEDGNQAWSSPIWVVGNA